jgi:hypothetical protein
VQTLATCFYINGSQANFEFKNLGEFETEFVNILGYESGAKMCLIYGKTKGRKSCATVPFSFS